MTTRTIAGHKVNIFRYNSVIIGAGAAGMNCAVHLHEFMTRKGVQNAQDRIAIITRGLPLGASRMSGSDKQTYYKMGTSPYVADSAESFAASLTAGGCCHEDLVLIEGIGSLREFYHLARSGVPFPHDPMGSYVGYKTDHDPYERATSAGPKTSRFMSQCLQREAENYGIKIHDHQELAELITVGEGSNKRIVGVACLDTSKLSNENYQINVFLCENLILAAGGPGELYETTVYPKGQIGIHGLALKAGLAAENLTESQFGLASIKFRWNVSGTYMQVIPRIYSTEAGGSDEREFLADYFPSMSKMATNIFLKGYQWPFDPQRIENCQSSLIDVLVFNETQKGRRVFMDFLQNPIGNDSMEPFALEDLAEEALVYLKTTAALQEKPIDRLAHMNPLAIDIYKDNGIDLWSQPLEIAVCAQHNNGGFAVNKWWESNIPHTFVIGEMAGTHGVKRPGGSALNAGQVGGLRAAEYIVNVYNCDIVKDTNHTETIEGQLDKLLTRWDSFKLSKNTREAKGVIAEIQGRMTKAGGHIRELSSAKAALQDSLALYENIRHQGLSVNKAADMVKAIQAEHLALASAGYLTAIVELLSQGGGSRGSYIVVSEDGLEIHPNILNIATGKPLKFKSENQELRQSVIRLICDPASPELFGRETIPARKAPADQKAFELAWKNFREGKIFKA
ncbi:MAG: FAD-binding protein [Actinobacteria bacterium]|nr:FAD-binding protein [Actinomycetota bacterium]